MTTKYNRLEKSEVESTFNGCRLLRPWHGGTYFNGVCAGKRTLRRWMKNEDAKPTPAPKETR